MKKSMLFSTVLMVVLLVVAISTATFAWYTSNTQVNVTDTVINSAESADANIEFVWKSGANYLYNGTTVAFSSGDNIYPMVPTKAPEAADTSMSFIGASVNATGTTFTADSAAMTPWTQNYTSVAVDSSYDLTTEQPDNWSTHYTQYYTKISDGVYNKLQVQESAPAWAADTYYELKATTSDPYGIPSGTTVTELYIANRATSGESGDLKITATITNNVGTTLASALRIAVFFQANGDAGVVYKGTLASSATATNYAANGSWTANDTVATEITSADYTATSATTGISIGSIAAGAEGRLVIYAWYDGNMLGNAQAGNSAQFTLNIAK